MMEKGSINVHVERLVIEGVPLPAGHERLLQRAFEGELVRLLEKGGIAPHLTAGGARPGGPVGGAGVSTSGDAAHLGREIARSVYRGIGK